MNIRLSIDEIVLEGIDLPPGGRAALEKSLTAELTQLLLAGTQDENEVNGYAIAEASAEPLRALSQHPATLGRQLAASVCGALGSQFASSLAPQGDSHRHRSPVGGGTGGAPGSSPLAATQNAGGQAVRGIPSATV